MVAVLFYISHKCEPTRRSIQQSFCSTKAAPHSPHLPKQQASYKLFGRWDHPTCRCSLVLQLSLYELMC